MDLRCFVLRGLWSKTLAFGSCRASFSGAVCDSLSTISRNPKTENNNRHMLVEFFPPLPRVCCINVTGTPAKVCI